MPVVEKLSEKWTVRFEGNCEIVRTIFQLTALSSEKTFREDHSLLAAKQIQAGKLTRFHYTVIRSEKLKPEKVTSFLVFLSPIKSDDGYQIGRRVSPDTRRPILYHVMSNEHAQKLNGGI